MTYKTLLPLLLATALPSIPANAQDQPVEAASLHQRLADADAAFAAWMTDNHIPGFAGVAPRISPD